MYENRSYLIFPMTKISKVDFSLVFQISEDTIRKSSDETKTFIKWEEESPSFVSDIVGAEGPYNHEEILNILSTEEWSPSNVEVI